MLPCVNAKHWGARKSLHLCLPSWLSPATPVIMALSSMQLLYMEHEDESRVVHHSGAFGAHVTSPPYATETWNYKADEYELSLLMTLIAVKVTWCTDKLGTLSDERFKCFVLSCWCSMFWRAGPLPAGIKDSWWQEVKIYSIKLHFSAEMHLVSAYLVFYLTKKWTKCKAGIMRAAVLHHQAGNYTKYSIV